VRDDVLVRDEALVELRLEHAVGEHAFARHGEVRRGFAVRNVDVLRIFEFGRSAAGEFLVESVHPAVCAAQPAGAATGGEHGGGRVIDLVMGAEAHRLELDRLAGRDLAAGNGVRSRIALKEIIEAAVFLNDIDDVFYLARAGRAERSQRDAALHIRQRALRASRQHSGGRSNDKPTTQTRCRHRRTLLPKLEEAFHRSRRFPCRRRTVACGC
jgi:hypothetical protein